MVQYSNHQRFVDFVRRKRTVKSINNKRKNFTLERSRNKRVRYQLGTRAYEYVFRIFFFSLPAGRFLYLSQGFNLFGHGVGYRQTVQRFTRIV